MRNFSNVLAALRSIRKSLGAWNGENFARVLLHPNDARNILDHAWTGEQPNTVVILMTEVPSGKVRVLEARVKGIAEVTIDPGPLPRPDDMFQPFARERPSTRITLTFETAPDPETGNQFSLGVL